ncbi:MAG: FMN-binding glutamate synthase family protein [Ilumatobacter sp.]|uniref:FMN-binding glutamate synthase family protein n=1 Tax=Ilumatobacter sp. TaxID=1967498 RepID=UPI003298EAB0
MIIYIRRKAFAAVAALTVVFLGLAVLEPWWLIAAVPTGLLTVLGLRDLLQPHHSILRNYPIVGHLRYLIEDAGPELNQYIVENDTEGRPFNREVRTLMYQRAKDVPDNTPFGTDLDVYASGYTWMAHSIAPKPRHDDAVAALRVDIGGSACEQPYSCSVLNISAMSFGSLGRAAITAMNTGAHAGNFAHNTGEGGLSRHHLEPGGDVVWQIGTGYFGCRTADGGFSPDAFEEQSAHPQVRMIEIKLSQGAKPGHGGILPGAKVTEEIARARHVPVGEDVFSPIHHRAFSTPLGLIEFISLLRRLSGAKPVGIKLCVGDPIEFMSIVKAMIETDVFPDFIVVDGAEGGTGAAPLEFSDSLGAPLIDGLMFVQNVLVGAGVRDRVTIGASGKLVSASAIAQALALGADFCNSARGFMFAVGCIQAKRCHTNRCPVGVTTQDPRLERGLVVPEKAKRVEQFHRNTVEALAEVLAAMGLEHPAQLTPDMVHKRVNAENVLTLSEIGPLFRPGSLLDGSAPALSLRHWALAAPEKFRP